MKRFFAFSAIASFLTLGLSPVPAGAQIETETIVLSPTGSNRPVHSVKGPDGNIPGPPFYVKPSVEIPGFAAKKSGNGANTPNTNPGGGSGGGNNGNGPAPLDQDPLVQSFDPSVATSILTQFEGAHNTDNPFLLNPPDPVGDVGPDHYVQMINLVTTVLDKDGNILPGPVVNTLGPTVNTDIFSGTNSICSTNNNGDPIVLYDEGADRWLLTYFAFERDLFGLPTTPFVQCVAASKTGDPTGAYHRYEFDLSAFGYLNDYPKFGITEEAITMTAHFFSFNIFFGSQYEGQFTAAINKGTLYNGQPTQIVGMNLGEFEEGFLPADRDGSAAVPQLFATNMSTPGFFDIWKMVPDFGTPSQTTMNLLQSIPIAPFDLDLCSATRERCVPHPGGGPDLETLGDRLMHRLQIRDFGTHLSMVAAITVDADAAPAGTPGRAGIRWYEFRSTDGGDVWSLHQEGTHAPNDGLHRWMPSIALNAAGEIGIGYLVSSETMPVEMRVTGQTVASSGTGVFDAEEGICRQGLFGSDFSGRSGDYSSLNVDPVNDTFWYTGQYGSVPTAAGWGTAVCEFDFSSGPVNQAPNVTITAPADGYGSLQGDTVTFTGTAIDPEEGDLSGSISWSSNLDGALGTGASIMTSALSIGTHTVTAEVTDSGNPAETGSDQITVTVSAPAAALSIVKTGTFNDEGGDGFADVGETIGYTFTVANTGNVTLTNVSVTDPKVTVAGGPTTLDVAETDTTTFTATYILTQADVNLGQVDNTATADSDESGPANDSETTLLPQAAALSIVKTATPTTYSAINDIISYSYLVTNTGNVTISGPFTVDDDRSTDEACPAGNLAPGGSLTCTATYTITQVDIDAGSVTNIASATGTGPESNPVTSPTDSETVTAVPLATMHVESILLGTQNLSQGFKRGTATVTILDNQGNPVDGANVNGMFTGDFNESYTLPTNGSGVVTFITSASQKGPDFSFCVSQVTDASSTYNPNDNPDPNFACGALPNQPPTVTITSPADSSTFGSGTLISFNGTANDLEDGNLSANLQWTSNIDIAIGTGAAFSAVLSDGTHTITASATDIGGQSGSDQITVIVGSASSVHVELITTGSVNAGGGNKHGTATVTIHDNLGNPVPGAVILGQFSGDITEPAGGTTNGSGTATMTTGGTARGGVSVSYCVLSVGVIGMDYDKSQNSDSSYDCGL